MRMRALRPSPWYQVLRRSRKRRASTRTTGRHGNRRRPGGRTLPRRPRIPSVDLIRRGGPAPLKSAENGRAGPSGRRDRCHDSAQLLADQSSRCGSIHIWRASRAPRRLSDCSEFFKHWPGEAENGRPPRADDDRWSRFPSRPSRERSRCEWRRRLARNVRRGERISMAVCVTAIRDRHQIRSASSSECSKSIWRRIRLFHPNELATDVVCGRLRPCRQPLGQSPPNVSRKSEPDLVTISLSAVSEAPRRDRSGVAAGCVGPGRF